MEKANELREKVRQGVMSASVACQSFLEETGRDLDEVVPVYRRTTSGLSWSEEVEHAKNLDVPATVAEPQEEEETSVSNKNNVDKDDDFAMFELFDSRAEGEGAQVAQGAHN